MTTAPIPGSLLNKLNPLKGLDEEGRRDFARRYRALQEQLDNPADRLKVMDSQGIESAVNFAALPGIEVHFEDDYEALYANLNALNRYLRRGVGLQLPGPPVHPAVHLLRRPRRRARAARADHEGSRCRRSSRPPAARRCTPRRSGPRTTASGRSAARPGINLATHLGSVTRYAPRARSGTRTRSCSATWTPSSGSSTTATGPAMETVGAAILQGWFARFPNMKLLLSEQGTRVAALPAAQAGPRLPHGPAGHLGQADPATVAATSREHCFVAPFPEENLDRVVEAVGVEPIVFGSRLPPRRGPARPDGLPRASSRTCPTTRSRAVMRGNLARFLGQED